MRKIYLILAIAGIMMTTACSNENNEPTSESNVTFTVNLDGIDSRTISDGTTVDQLVFAVYDDQGNEIPALRQNDIQIEDKQATVTTKVAMGQKYSFAFWAQKKKEGSLNDNGYYNTTDLKDVVVSYAGYANDENRDAFTASWSIEKVTGPINKTITLTRPFAQVDYVCSLDEWTDLLNSNYKLLGSDLVVDAGAYTHYNVLTGEATLPTTTPITFALSDEWRHYQYATDYNFLGFVTSKPGNNYNNLFTISENESKFWLSMNYILADKELETNLTGVKMNIYGMGANGPRPQAVSLDQLPIKRNHRTIVFVSGLTTMVSVWIKIDPNSSGDVIID